MRERGRDRSIPLDKYAARSDEFCEFPPSRSALTVVYPVVVVVGLCLVEQRVKDNAIERIWLKPASIAVTS